MQKARTGRHGITAGLKIASMNPRVAEVYRIACACNNIVTPGTRARGARPRERDRLSAAGARARLQTMAQLSRRTDAQRSKRAAAEAAVVQATEALLAEGASFADLPIEQIATRAGISRPAFYSHFRDKRELLMRLTGGLAEELYGEAERWWSGEDDGAAELAVAMAQIVAIYRRHAALLRTIVEAAAYDPEVATYWRALVGRFVAATRARIEREQAAGAVDGALPAQSVAFGLCWMTERAAYEHLAQDGDLEDAGLVDGLLAIWLGAVYGRSR